jgi:single-strand DNA-binding protein
MINKINIAGRVGGDPEVSYLDGGKVVAKFSVAVNRGKDEPPNWFNVEVWNKQAETAAGYVKKGSLVGITGRLGFNEWSDRETGEFRRKHVITADPRRGLSLLGSSKKQQEEYDDDSF